MPDRLASVTLIEPCNTVARLSGKFWRDGALLVLPGAERKQRVVEELLGRPAPGSVLDNLMQLVMAAGSEFVSFGTPFPRFPVIPCCGRSTFPFKFCWRATLFTTLKAGSTGYGGWRRRGVIAYGGTRHTCCRVRLSEKSARASVTSRRNKPLDRWWSGSCSGGTGRPPRNRTDS